jgi:hypothetical protein
VAEGVGKDSFLASPWACGPTPKLPSAFREASFSITFTRMRSSSSPQTPQRRLGTVEGSESCQEGADDFLPLADSHDGGVLVDSVPSPPSWLGHRLPLPPASQGTAADGPDSVGPHDIEKGWKGLEDGVGVNPQPIDNTAFLSGGGKCSTVILEDSGDRDVGMLMLRSNLEGTSRTSGRRDSGEEGREDEKAELPRQPAVFRDWRRARVLAETSLGIESDAHRSATDKPLNRQEEPGTEEEGPFTAPCARGYSSDPTASSQTSIAPSPKPRTKSGLSIW